MCRMKTDRQTERMIKERLGSYTYLTYILLTYLPGIEGATENQDTILAERY